MCHTAKQHANLIKITPDLDTLEGWENRHRKVLKQAHVNQGGVCIWCQRETFLWWEVTTEEFKALGKLKLATREHMTPKSEGGDHTIDNITCACYRCNSLRGTIPENQFKWVASDIRRLNRFVARKQEKRAAKKRLKKEQHEALIAYHQTHKLTKRPHKEQKTFSALIHFCKSKSNHHENVRTGRIYEIMWKQEQTTWRNLSCWCKQITDNWKTGIYANKPNKAPF